jgi:plasmid stabilization system protein ParE
MNRLDRLNLAPEAIEDLASLHAYIAADAVDAADKVYLHVATRIDRLRYMPYVNPVYQGRNTPDLTVYKMSVNPYIVYYRVSESTMSVSVARVLHSVRRQPRRFR